MRAHLTTISLLFAMLGAVPGSVGAQITAIRAGHLLDVHSGRWIADAVILVEDGEITAVGPSVQVPPGAESIDLSDSFVLPGLIDTHTHLLLQPDYGENNPILHKSVSYRTVEGVAAARATLMAGFTSIRDVDSEGADWADVAIRDGVKAGLIVGPHMQVATRAISITAGHMNQSKVAPEIEVPQFGALADTPAELVREVRTQIKYGADFIKLYTTGTLRHIDPRTMTVLSQYSQEEIDLVVREAARFGKDVAVHAYGGEGAKLAIRGGVRSIEHGFMLEESTLDLMVEHGTYWVPTMTVYIPDGPREDWEELRRRIVDSHRQVFQMAMRKGVKIAFGTDAGAFEHGDNYREMELMVSYGMEPLDVIRSATVAAAELMRIAGEVGSIERGKRADLIAVPNDPLADISVLREVPFVMKSGIVYKN